MKKAVISCMMVVLLCACTNQSQQKNIELSNRRDSLAYAMGVCLGQQLSNISTELKSEEGKAQFLKGVDEMMDEGLNDNKDSSSIKHTVDIVFGQLLFMSKTMSYWQNEISMSDFVEGMNDDASMNYSRMDTAQCRAFLDSFFKLPEEERTKDEIVFKKASYAMGMLANNIINNEERENDAIEYEDNQEQNIDNYVLRYATTASVWQLVSSTDPYTLGKRTGQYISQNPNGLVKDKADSKHMQSLNYQGLKDYMNSKPLITEDKATDVFNQTVAEIWGQ